MDTLKHCFITIVFSCLCSEMSNAASTTTLTPPQLEYGATCAETTSVCSTSGAMCTSSNICACDDTHYYDMATNACIQKLAFAGTCSETSQCDTTSDQNIECIQTAADKKCLCKDGWYRPNTSPTSCVETTQLKPAISDPPSIGTGNIGISWTNTVANGGYTFNYMVVWSQGSPGSPGNVSTQQTTYNIQPLSPGTVYTVTVELTITQYGRSQTITSDQKPFTTEQVFGGICNNTIQCDNSNPNIVCVQITGQPDDRCICQGGMYRPSSSSSCANTSVLRPVITDPPSIGTGNIDISWINTDVPGGYNYSYTVLWSPGPPGSPGSASTQQKSYNIQPLSPGTEYTVTVELTITQYGRSQTTISVPRTFETNKQAFGGECNETSQCDTSDTNIECVQITADKKCLCKAGWYRPNTSPCVETNSLKPAIVDTPSIGTGNIYISWTNTDVTGGYSYGYTVAWSPGSPVPSVSASQKNYNIQPLSPGTVYTVTVALTITLLGRSQTITSDPKAFTTKKVFGGACNETSQCDTSDSNIDCIQTTVPSDKKCLCKSGWYRPNTSPVSCVQFSVLRPVITDPPSIGTGTISISWTNTDVTEGYTYIYTVVWSPGPPGSPGSPGTASTQQKNYNIQPLSQGTEYTVTVAHTITQYGRSQTITSVQRNITTKIAYNQTCSQPGLCIDARTNCYSGSCRCDEGYYRATDCSSIEQLKPTSVTAYVNDTTTMTASWVAPSNAIITGYEVTVTSGGITPISVDRDIRTTPITGLTPGRLYTVSVKTKITYLQGRDEMTDVVPAASERTTPAAIVELDSKTNRTAPDITIVFSKAEGDADKYIVTLSRRDGDTYNQRHEPPHGSGQDLISVVFTGVVPAVSYTLTIKTQSGNLFSSPFTTVILVQAKPAGSVTNLTSFDNTSRSIAVEWSRPLNPNGNIFEYIVDVKTGSPSKCVKRVIVNCTECSRNMTMPQMQTECTTDVTVVISQADIENVDHVIQHNITGLNPDTSYSIDVVAVNQEGQGTPDQVNLLLPEEAAGEPTNFKVQSRSSSEITLTWDPPQPRPGVTQYNLTVYEKQEEGDGYEPSQNISINDWKTKTKIIGSLSSYWSYKFDIVANTKIGASMIVNSSVEMTLESAPIGVTDFMIESVPGVFNKVQVSWKCPQQKDGRNGKIVSANLNYYTNQQTTYVEPVRSNKNFSDTGKKCMWRENVTVTTEFLYQFQVRLFNKAYAGAVVNDSKEIQGGAPKQSEVRESVKVGAIEAEETASLTICPKCLYDRTNGQVINNGLIVCKKEGSCGQSRKRRAATKAEDYDKMDNWNVASADSFNTQYRATKEDWLVGNNEQSTLAFTVGEEDCSGNPKDVFCNGKLPAGETFIVFAFTCTKQGCTTSQSIEVKTKASILLGAVIGAVVAAIVVIIVVIVIVIIRRRRNAKMKQADPSEIEAVGDLILRKRPIRMKDFETRVEEMHKDSNLLYSEEFEDIGALSPKHTCTASETGGNKLRNRYVNILPFDHSRVKLRSTGDDDDDETDYINANYIPGYNSPREFIATQGPMTGTVADFWRMIWEQDVNIIIMLSDLLEKGKPKVDRYWPENMKEAVQYGEIVVEMINYSPLNKYIMKIFQITVGDESRKVRHYFLPGWQDFGANLTPDDVISFVRDVRMQKKPTDKGPICVHCSAGVGRTGTYVSLDVFKQAIDEENFDKELDVFDFVMKMRENRSYMVQTEKQYIFIHDTIKEMLIRKKKEIAERDNIYQNSDLKPEENIYANQAYEPDPEELYMNVEPGQPTTVL
ncbi:receptor-type tyrosine-protein phosphatase beta-like isoform X2 [Haliotis rufescens]|uniref:receptor-type tyrosine-protein phosphatase beta-like isoform X2 n=1 Tax=Haliotis rufescens TaxID=6454 RepID=UPI00201F6C05|nr:receptor-type tyrosine-protein phosphatase beta-like isoform X2 [Haliotis rufescens]